MATSDPMTVARLRAVAGSTSAILSWSAAHHAAGYHVFQNGLPIGATTTTKFAIAGLSEATGYVFTVAAIDAAGQIANSAPVALLTQAVPLSIG